jgi:hypothetical protein
MNDIRDMLREFADQLEKQYEGKEESPAAQSAKSFREVLLTASASIDGLCSRVAELEAEKIELQGEVEVLSGLVPKEQSRIIVPN